MQTHPTSTFMYFFASTLFYFLLFLVPLESAFAQKSAQKLPQKQNYALITQKQIIALDRFEWRTLYFSDSPEKAFASIPASQSISNIRNAIEGRSTLEMHPQQQWISYTQASLSQYPFLHLQMCVRPPALSLKEKLRWRDFFNAGGNLYVDACSQGKTLTAEWKQWGKSIYPETFWFAINRNHPFFFSFYLLNKLMFLEKKGPSLYALNNDGRSIILLNQSRQWSWERLQRSKIQVAGNAPRAERRLRLYINLIMYNLTGSYKSDQVHLPTLLLRRK